MIFVIDQSKYYYLNLKIKINNSFNLMSNLIPRWILSNFLKTLSLFTSKMLTV